MFLFSAIDISNLLNASESTLSKHLGKVVSRERHPGKNFSNFKNNDYLFTVRMSRGRASSFTVESINGKSQSEIAKDLGFDLRKAKLIFRNRFNSEYYLDNNVIRLISWDGSKINCLQFHSKSHQM